MSALLSLTGLDFITSISGAATSISNVGPGLGSIIGPNGDFSSLPDVSKWILSCWYDFRKIRIICYTSFISYLLFGEIN